MTLHTRRTFVATVAAATAGAVLAAPKKPAKRTILILEDVMGPLAVPQAQYAIQRGHIVTVLSRGEPSPGLSEKAEHVSGKGNRDYAALAGRKFDVILDNAGARQKRWVAEAGAHLLPGGHYILRGTTEGKTDDIVAETFPNATIVRTGVLAGPRDKTDEFTYWAVRLTGGGEVLAPVGPDVAAPFIDMRDLGEFMVRLAEQRTFGDFHAVAGLTMGQMLEGLRKATGSSATFRWVPQSFLDANYVKLPVWSTEPWDPTEAVRKGLTIRPVRETAEWVLTWFQSLDDERQLQLKGGLTREREAELLALWKKQNATGT
jgi:2'-hydroxyisoflavone reductase